MPKRIGFLYERVVSVENCIAAEAEMAKRKKHNRRASIIKAAPESYGEDLAKMLAAGEWKPEPYKEHVIFDGYRKKERRIKVPCLRDQAVHHAVMRVTAPYIMRRNYFYNCGSIPFAGQTRASRAWQGWLKGKHPPKYGQQLDIRKFYDTCPHAAVMAALRRIFKDEKFLALHAQILASMSENGIGLAIGFYPSQWYANLVLQQIDTAIKQTFGKRLKMTRYMDNIGMAGNRKRTLHKARAVVEKALAELGLELKRDWQVRSIEPDGFTYLSYRHHYGYSVMTKTLMYRMTRKIKSARRNMTYKAAAGFMSYLGILQGCNSYNYRRKHLYRVISIRKCKEVIRREAKDRLRRAAAAV